MPARACFCLMWTGTHACKYTHTQVDTGLPMDRGSPNYVTTKPRNYPTTKEKMSKNRVASTTDGQYNLQHQKETVMESIPELSQDYRLIEQAIRFIEANAQRQPELHEIANAAGLSESHFQRTFTRWA